MSGTCLEGLPHPAETAREGVEGVAVELADGREWLFARPTVRLLPRFNPDGSCEVESYVGYAPRVEPYLETLIAACRADPDNVPVKAIFAAARALLCEAHELDPIDAAGLLAGSLGNLKRICAAIVEATGLGGDVDETPPVADGDGGGD